MFLYSTIEFKKSHRGSKGPKTARSSHLDVVFEVSAEKDACFSGSGAERLVMKPNGTLINERWVHFLYF